MRMSTDRDTDTGTGLRPTAMRLATTLCSHHRTVTTRIAIALRTDTVLLPHTATRTHTVIHRRTPITGPPTAHTADVVIMNAARIGIATTGTAAIGAREIGIGVTRIAATGMVGIGLAA